MLSQFSLRKTGLERCQPERGGRSQPERKNGENVICRREEQSAAAAGGYKTCFIKKKQQPLLEEGYLRRRICIKKRAESAKMTGKKKKKEGRFIDLEEERGGHPAGLKKKVGTKKGKLQKPA